MDNLGIIYFLRYSDIKNCLVGELGIGDIIEYNFIKYKIWDIILNKQDFNKSKIVITVIQFGYNSNFSEITFNDDFKIQILQFEDDLHHYYLLQQHNISNDFIDYEQVEILDRDNNMRYNIKKITIEKKLDFLLNLQN